MGLVSRSSLAVGLTDCHSIPFLVLSTIIAITIERYQRNIYTNIKSDCSYYNIDTHNNDSTNKHMNKSSPGGSKSSGIRLRCHHPDSDPDNGNDDDEHGDAPQPASKTINNVKNIINS